MTSLKSPETRRNVYAYTLLVCVAAIAFVGILNIWGAGLSQTFTGKAILSLVVLAGLSGFLYTLTHNHDVKLIKRLGNITGIIAIIISAMILGQIWLDLFKDIIFGKLIGTLVILGLIAAFCIAVFDDFFENKKLKDENYLD